MNTASGFSRSRQRRGEDEQIFLLGDVDLVEHEDQRLAAVFEPSSIASTRAPTLAAASITRTIRSASSAPSQAAADHRPVEPAVRREDARRVDQQDLRLALDRDAHQPGARGLRLGADDRDLLPDQRIDQGRLAGVGRAEHGDQAAARVIASAPAKRPRRRFRLPAWTRPSASASPCRPSADLDREARRMMRRRCGATSS